jgi:hypothetical protein
MNDCSISLPRYRRAFPVLPASSKSSARGRRARRRPQRARFYKDRGYDISMSICRERLMADDSDLIRRADSLINPEADPAGVDRRESSRRLRRRRSFIASVDRPVKLTPPDRSGAKMRTCRCSPKSYRPPKPDSRRQRQRTSSRGCARCLPRTSPMSSIGNCATICPDADRSRSVRCCRATAARPRATIETALHDFLDAARTTAAAPGRSRQCAHKARQTQA